MMKNLNLTATVLGQVCLFVFSVIGIPIGGVMGLPSLLGVCGGALRDFDGRLFLDLWATTACQCAASSACVFWKKWGNMMQCVRSDRSLAVGFRAAGNSATVCKTATGGKNADGESDWNMIQIFKSPHLRNIFFFSILMAMSIPLIDTLYIYPNFKQQLIENTEKEAIRVANALSDNLSLNHNLYTPDHFPTEDWSKLEKMTLNYGLMKLKIYSPQGIVVYSSQKNEIGDHHRHPYLNDIAENGRVYSKVVRKNEVSLEGETFVRDVVETYVPLIDDNEFVGFFEIYYDITDQKKDLEILLAQSYGMLGTVLALLCCTLLFVIHQAGKGHAQKIFAETSLRKHQQELDRIIEKRTIQLKEANRQLTSEISERCKNEKTLKKTTDRLKQTLEELTITQATMLQSEKMAAIGFLAAGVAHEINNPVGFVKCNLASIEEYRQNVWAQLGRLEKFKAMVLESNTVLDPKAYRLAREIDWVAGGRDMTFMAEDFESVVAESKEGVDRIARIVADLKNFSHADNGEIACIDLTEGIESTLNIVWNELKYKTTVTTDLGDIPLIKGNRHQINQVILNMLVNAAQSIEKSGTIGIATCKKGHYVEMIISDTGCGIAPENLTRIYDPFFTTKEVGQGTGLGLNVVYNIIRNHGGTIEVQSKVRQGTVFTIKLPIEGVV
jgi:signal transduction histidine kinase